MNEFLCVTQLTVPSAKDFQWNIKTPKCKPLFKDNLQSVLCIGSAHNKGCPLSKLHLWTGEYLCWICLYSTELKKASSYIFIGNARPVQLACFVYTLVL